MNQTFVTAVGAIAVLSLVVVFLVRLVRAYTPPPIAAVIVNVLGAGVVLVLAASVDGIEAAVYGVGAGIFVLNALSAGAGDDA